MSSTSPPSSPLFFSFSVSEFFIFLTFSPLSSLCSPLYPFFRPTSFFPTLLPSSFSAPFPSFFPTPFSSFFPTPFPSFFPASFPSFLFIYLLPSFRPFPTPFRSFLIFFFTSSLPFVFPTPLPSFFPTPFLFLFSLLSSPSPSSSSAYLRPYNRSLIPQFPTPLRLLIF